MSTSSRCPSPVSDPSRVAALWLLAGLLLVACGRSAETGRGDAGAHGPPPGSEAAGQAPEPAEPERSWTLTEDGIPTPDLEELDPDVRDLFEQMHARLRKKPDSWFSWGHYGVALEANGYPEIAVEALRRATTGDPEDFRWAYMYAVASEEAGASPDEAIPLYEAAIEIDPSYPLTYYHVAQNQARLGRTDQARRSYEAALEQEEGFAMAHRALGRLLLESGESEAALEHLERAAELAPDDAVVQTLLVEAYSRAGRREDARRAESRAMELPALEALPDSLLHEGRVKYRRGAEADLARGIRLREEGDLEGAIVAFQAAAQADPERVLCQLHLGRTYREAGKLEQAVHHLRLAANLPTSKPLERLGAHFMLGDALARQGQLAEAAYQLGKARDLVPQNPAVQLKLAVTLDRDGRDEKAREAYDRAEDLAGDPRTMGQSWEDAYLSDEELEVLLPVYRGRVEAAPADPDRLYLLGVILELEGETDRAKELYQRAAVIAPQHRAAHHLRAMEEEAAAATSS